MEILIKNRNFNQRPESLQTNTSKYSIRKDRKFTDEYE